MSKPQFDRVIHAPNRLRICALLTPLEEAEFQTLRNALGVSDSVLSKHIGQLVEAGYVKLRKSAVNGRQRTWARLSAKGHKALAAHVEALQDVISGASGNKPGRNQTGSRTDLSN